MTIPASISARIAAILPRLGSNHDGEVIASVRAMQRILASANLDWHDLTATFQSGAATAPTLPSQKKGRPCPKEPRAPRWKTLGAERRASWLVAILDADNLSSWETTFIKSIQEQTLDNPTKKLSPRQIEILDRIMSEAVGYGVTP
jgi:hypothetical protein